jgi:hypothetical protein
MLLEDRFHYEPICVVAQECGPLSGPGCAD